jgi:SAM-dependent methyltransferase
MSAPEKWLKLKLALVSGRAEELDAPPGGVPVMSPTPKDLHGTSRAAMRRTMFLYQDGVVLCTTARALDDLGVLKPSLTADCSLADLYPQITPTGFGYLRAGVRCLASQGWLAAEPTLEPETTVLRWTDAGRIAARHLDRYLALGRFLAGFASTDPDAWSRPWDAARTASFLELVEPACDRWRLAAEVPAQERGLMTAHLDAALAVPTMLWLRGAGRLAEEGPELPEDEAGRGMGRLLAALGWIEGGSGCWTASGLQSRAFAVHFGMVGSYLPLLARLPDLYRGTVTVASAPQSDSTEWHVHRGLNVSASAAAHRRYFADADGIFLELFDREPVEGQPRFVADMGCGDGSWLVHLYGLIAERTLRGERLHSDPLVMVGIDCSLTALELARRALGEAGVPAVLVRGDVSYPEQVRSTLAERGLVMEEGLHIRAFLDHDRAYLGADPDISVSGWATGAYVDDLGQPLDGAAVERDLVAHLRRWAPHLRKHGLVVLEAHSVAPRVARRHLGALHSVAFDAYHAYSHQYPIEHPAFMRCCQHAGLQPASHCERHYPSSRPFVAVSLNRFLTAEEDTVLPALDDGASREDTWRPDPGTDLEDGRALHELLFVGGDLRYPRLWCTAPTGFVVAGALEAIEARLASAREGDAIRVLDYGAGTGTAAIELLKACRERGIERRLGRRGATLELHLVDLPSSWFAQGFALLKGCAWTRFHSLRAADGSFRPLLEVTGGRAMDAVMANMVFHLIPPRALGRAAADLARVVTPGGRLLWSAPDLAPPGSYAVLLHDPNRALRERWLELLAGERSPGPFPLENGHARLPVTPHLQDSVRLARRSLDVAALREAQCRADRRILPQAHAAADVVAALDRHFSGRVEFRTYEMLCEDILDALLVPSNQMEYLPEIADRALREEVIRELMLGEVLPAMQEQPAGTALGLNLQWTLGSFRTPRLTPGPWTDKRQRRQPKK